MPKTSTPTFNYAVLDPESRIVVRQKTTEIHRLVKRAAAALVELGQLLLDVKAQLRHGRWMPWLTAEFDWTDRTAQRYMQLAREFKSDTVSDLPVKALHLLAAPSTAQEARDEVQKRIADGLRLDYEDVKDIADDVADEIFGALSPEQQLEVIQREQDNALRQAAPLMRKPDRTRKIERVQRHAEKARNAAVGLEEEGDAIVDWMTLALERADELLRE